MLITLPRCSFRTSLSGVVSEGVAEVETADGSDENAKCGDQQRLARGFFKFFEKVASSGGRYFGRTPKGVRERKANEHEETSSACRMRGHLRIRHLGLCRGADITHPGPKRLRALRVRYAEHNSAERSLHCKEVSIQLGR